MREGGGASARVSDVPAYATKPEARRVDEDVAGGVRVGVGGDGG